MNDGHEELTTGTRERFEKGIYQRKSSYLRPPHNQTRNANSEAYLPLPSHWSQLGHLTSTLLVCRDEDGVSGDEDLSGVSSEFAILRTNGPSCRLDTGMVLVAIAGVGVSMKAVTPCIDLVSMLCIAAKTIPTSKHLSIQTQISL
jgi:hypothetical protein